MLLIGLVLCVNGFEVHHCLLSFLQKKQADNDLLDDFSQLPFYVVQWQANLIYVMLKSESFTTAYDILSI